MSDYPQEVEQAVDRQAYFGARGLARVSACRSGTPRHPMTMA